MPRLPILTLLLTLALAVTKATAPAIAQPYFPQPIAEALTQANELPTEVQERLFRYVAQEHNRPLSSLQITSLAPMTWPDGCLGLGSPVELCLAALTPGWRVSVTDGQSTWDYRTDTSGDVIHPERPSSTPPYTDITGLYQAEITAAIRQTIMTGFPAENRFYPERTITREELASAVTRALLQAPTLMPEGAAIQLPALPDRVDTSPFSDVAPIRWSAPAIQYLRELGLLQGYPDGRFRPSQPVTRAELIALLLKMDVYLVELRQWDGRDRSNLSPTFMFSDTQGHWAERYIAVMSENCRAAEPLNGTGSQFAPDAPATRGYAAATIMRDLQCLSLPKL